VSNAGNSNLVNRMEMLVGNSYIGFRGSRSIGGGMKTIWQVESVVPIDEGVDGTLATRDSFLGMEAGWGTLRLGFMDTPFKKAGDVVGFLGVSSGNFVQTNPVLRQVGFAQGSGGPNRAARFHERRGNAIDYASPTYFGGLQYLTQYSIGNPSETSKTSDPPRDPRFVSMALKWEAGPWYFAAMHETHFDMFGGSSQFRAERPATIDPNNPAGPAVVTSSTAFRAASVMRNSETASVHSKDTAAQVTAMFKFGGHTLEADYIVKKYTENGEASGITGRFQEYKNNAWMVAWEARWSSQIRTAVTFVNADAGTCKLFRSNCSTSGLEGKQYSVGGSYYIDPSTYLFLIGSKIDNGASARYDNVANGAPATGEDVTQIALGLAHTF
jgi:predicted porin